MSSISEHLWNRDSLRLLLLLVLVGNLISVVYFFRSDNDDDNNRQKRSSSNAKSDRFKAADTKLIHIVKDASWDWTEREFLDGFGDCPNYSNCRVKTHVLTNESTPSAVPNYGHAVVFTAQALHLHHNSEFWSQAAARKTSADILWAFHSLNNPFDLPLDFMTFRNYGFNFTMTYKPSSDIFTPFNFWQSSGQPSSPKMLAAKNYAGKKTRKVLWQIEGPCRSVNDRMKYAQELSEYISVDIIGHCWDEDLGRERQVDFSTHGNGVQRRGVMEDYKFYLAFEEISCRDYVTDVYFDVVARENIVPIVMGAQKDAYELLGPPDSFIHIDDFSGPKDLAKYLRSLDENDHLYNRYFRYVGTGSLGVPVSAMCRLCDAVNYFQEAAPQSYSKEEMEAFWSVADCNINSILYNNEL